MRRLLRRLWRRAARRPVPPALVPKVEALDPGLRNALESFRG